MALRLITIIFLCAAMPVLAWADTYYWVDENGKRHYGDRVPPEESKRERQVIDQRGFTVKTLPREKSAEEHAREAQETAEQNKAQAEQEQTRAEQAKYDTALLTSYENVEAIERVRDDRVSILDASILVEVQAHADNNRRLGKLREEEKALLDRGKPVSESLRAKLDDVLRRIRINERNITELKNQRRQIEAKYNQDIARYLELTSSPN